MTHYNHHHNHLRPPALDHLMDLPIKGPYHDMECAPALYCRCKVRRRATTKHHLLNNIMDIIMMTWTGPQPRHDNIAMAGHTETQGNHATCRERRTNTHVVSWTSLT